MTPAKTCAKWAMNSAQQQVVLVVAVGSMCQMKYACMVNGVTQLIMMKADVLSQFDTIRVCSRYKTSQGEIDYLPYDIQPSSVQPVYENLEGWQADLTGMREAAELPSQLSAYIDYLEAKLEVPITIVSVGPDRSQTILREKAMA